MKYIEKIDRTRKYTTDEVLTTILDKVNELVDAHNHMVDEKKNISICINGKSMSTLVSDINSIKTKITTINKGEI